MTNVVGIGGKPRSGKDKLAEVFMEAGYFGFSFGDFIRERSRQRHRDKPDPISVANMTETANWLRHTKGADVVLKEALRQFNEKQKQGANYEGLLLLSVRAPVEVDFILAHEGELIWVEAADEVRHKRALKNLRPGEAAQSLKEFKEQEDLQWQPQPGIPPDAQMNLSYVKEHATRTLVNNGDDLSLFLQAGRLLAKELRAA